MKKEKQQYVVRKFVMASSAKDAIKIEKTMDVDDVWLDQDWIKQKNTQLQPAVGFATQIEDEE
ncbi:MAG: hypothetical protein IPM48_14510 [Saprospiraceae bacterium]|nr:hypothetical protein [Saprospiraceae bacterium]